MVVPATAQKFSLAGHAIVALNRLEKTFDREKWLANGAGSTKSPRSSGLWLRKKGKPERGKRRGHSAGLSDEDLERACEDLRKIEMDLAFEVVESYQDRRTVGFVDGLLTSQALVQTVNLLCGDLGARWPNFSPLSSDSRARALSLRR